MAEVEAEPVIQNSCYNVYYEEEPGEETIPCEKLDIPANLVFLRNKEEVINREFPQIIEDQSLLEKVVSNYIIVKRILSFLPWQDKVACKFVCSTWRSAVNALQKEQLSPSDFAMSMKLSAIRAGIKLEQSNVFYTEPLVALLFGNMLGFGCTYACDTLRSHPCDPPCDWSHHLLDLAEHLIVSPKKCMLAVKVCDASYMPLKHSKTYRHTIGKKQKRFSSGFIGGLYIPVIPNVNFQIINLRSAEDIKKGFMQAIDKIVETDYIKGALAFINGSFILHNVDDVVFIDYLKKAQPNVPYALGGSIVEDTVTDEDDMNIMLEAVSIGKDLVTENLASVAVFSVPKSIVDNPTENGCNFDMFSLIIKSSEWSKSKIQSAINEFATKIPHFEHSVVVKLSCVGRDAKHEYEQEFFRAAFPRTRLAGCYGNGEVGHNHPARPKPDTFSTVKRSRTELSPEYGILYSYSTIFVYIGWGNIVTPAQST